MSEFDLALQDYAAYIVEDYRRWRSRTGDPVVVDSDFTVEINLGKTYAKVIVNTFAQKSVHSFVVLKSGEKFNFGDILKAASWAAPAKNKARGNVLDGDWFRATWTGIS